MTGLMPGELPHHGTPDGKLWHETLNVPQVTIATAIIFCHRFFLRQSHAKNDRRTIATVCMFLAGKVEETPRPLKDVILVSYEIIHKKDPAAAQRIKQKEVYEQQKELILLGERVVLATLGFDLNVQHPYKPLVEAIKKFNVAKNALAQVAWNFVNDGLRTSLCLQFKPHHIAAGLVARVDVTPRQLEEVSNQMLELYEQNRLPPAQGSEVEGSAGGTRAASKAPSANEEQASKQISSQAPQHSSVERTAVPQRGTENQSNDGSAEMGSDITDHNLDIRESHNSEQLTHQDNKREVSNRSKSGTERDQDRIVGTKEGAEVGRRDESALNNSGSNVGRNLERREVPLGHSPNEAIKIDKDKLKALAAMGKKRKEQRGEMALKKDVMDEDDLIERELEDGIELAVEDEKNKRERRQNWSKPDGEDHHGGENHEETRDGRYMNMKVQFQKDMDEDNAEEGEMIDDASSSLNNRKRRMGSPPGRQPEMKKHLDSSYHNDLAE
ncbi:hypothetical protein GYH30_054552 [Glycine max]|nr:hypothetical protein GYH30_054552 [Glycine max]